MEFIVSIWNFVIALFSYTTLKKFNKPKTGSFFVFKKYVEEKHIDRELHYVFSETKYKSFWNKMLIFSFICSFITVISTITLMIAFKILIPLVVLNAIYLFIHFFIIMNMIKL